MSMKNNVLPDFQEYLRSMSLVHENYIPFYAHWASKFLSFSCDHENLSHELKVEKFMDHLTSRERVSDWQIRQAHDAIKLYIHQYLNSSDSQSGSLHTQKREHKSLRSRIMEEMRQALRIKHYAYRTEISYLEWIKEFYRYTTSVKKKEFNEFCSWCCVSLDYRS